MTRTITVEERRARLARRHRLLPADRTDDVAAIADDLVALHSSDPVTVYLSLWARMRNPSVAAVEKALYDDRTLVRHHAMRRTLWVATPEVVRLMHAAATRKVAAAERRRLVRMLADNGVADPEAWLEDAAARVLSVLHAQGPLGARRIGELVPDLRLPLSIGAGAYATTVAAHTRLLVQLGFEGGLVRTRPHGTWISGQYAYAAADTWVEGGLETPGLSEREAAPRLADLWLRRFGPGTTADLQWWTGWTATLTRHALSDCGAVPVDLDGEPGWLAVSDDAAPGGPVEPWVALLPGLDPTTMGWKQRGWYLPDASADAFDRNGNAGPTIWADGRIVGAWVQAADGEIRTHYFLDPSARTRRRVEAEVERITALLGDDRHSVRFPGMQHQRLLDR